MPRVRHRYPLLNFARHLAEAEYWGYIAEHVAMGSGDALDTEGRSPMQQRSWHELQEKENSKLRHEFL
jgi:hypothetical protein